MLNTNFSPWPSFSSEESDAISEILLSNKVNYWTGNIGKKFEKEFAEYTDTKYGIAVFNGTVAIDLAFNAIDLNRGDEVIVTPKTFIASASSIALAGAKPVFADIDLNSQNITAETIKPHITDNTKAIICVHLAGWPCEMDEILDLAAEHNLYVIEDCAQAHGAKYKGKSVGSFGDIGCWSFCQDKIMTTGGEGGMVTTNSEKLWNKMWSYKDHGKSWDTVYKKNHPPGFRWLHESYGTNFRMTEIQAKIGSIQLKKLEEWNKKRNSNMKEIYDSIRDFNYIRIPDVPNYIRHAAYKCYFFIENGKRDEILNHLNNKGLPAMVGSCSEVYREKAFSELKVQRQKNAKELTDTSLSLFVHPTLTKEEVKKICTILKEVLSQF